ASYQIVLKGNTDADGKDDYNQKLSLRRTQSVSAYLVAQGVPASAISTAAFGETQPIADNASLTGKQANRRVDILVNYMIENQAVTQAEPTGDLETLFKSLALAPQVFQFNNDRDTIFVCAKGSMLTLEAGSFDLPKGSIVTLQAKEVLSKSDMLLENLTTTSNRQLLSSGGMMHVAAFYENGAPMGLKSDKALKISIPTPNYDAKMQYFKGSRTETEQSIDWALMADAGIANEAGTKFIDFPEYRRVSYNLPRDFEDNLALKIYAREKRFWHENYYNYFLGQLSDTCGKLYNEKIAYKPADTTRRVVLHQPDGFWEHVQNLFSRRKDTLTSIRPARTTKSYEILSDLSPKCNALADLGKKQHAETSNWLVLDQSVRKDMYDLLEKAFGVTELPALRARLKAKILDFEEQRAEYLQRNTLFRQKMNSKQDTFYAFYLQKRKDWYQKQDEAMDKAMTAGGFKKENLSYYLFKTNELGWVNCDFFVQNQEAVTVEVGLKKDKNLDAKIVFKDDMVAMSANGYGADVAFTGVPKGRKAWLVLMDFKENRPRLALQEIEVGQPVPAAEFRSMSIAQIRQALTQLN
ncbi:MAG: hypothetical protein RL329_616, partial [Bacteroidota bacterium]